MDTASTLVVIGAGHAGVELAVAARQQGWAGAIVLLGDEAHEPYHRPPLSKAFLAGAAAAASLGLRERAAYEKAGITLRVGARVAQFDRAAHAVTLEGGEVIHYTRLALCTGGRPRLLEVPGMEAGQPANLHYLRTQNDSLAIAASVRQGAHVVVIGGGYVGLEVAASSRKLGADVTVLEMQPRVLARVTGAAMSAFYQGVHEGAGVRVRTGVAVTGLERDGPGGKVIAVLVKNAQGEHERLPADAVVVGVGMLPNIELAEAAGLAVDRGIIVDEHAATSDPDIVAAGDCTVHDSALYGRRIRLESVPNALEQARAAAAWLCGKLKPNQSVPWFWSDQYELKLQMAGLSEGHDQCVIRGSVQARSFCAFYLQGGVLLAVDAVNAPMDFMQAKRALSEHLALDAGALADTAIPLKTLLAKPAVPATP
jgi:3-phenylpropionate/trans-cinnamate dioxygenase ferredoxin reductase subunit